MRLTSLLLLHEFQRFHKIFLVFAQLVWVEKDVVFDNILEAFRRALKFDIFTKNRRLIGLPHLIRLTIFRLLRCLLPGIAL